MPPGALPTMQWWMYTPNKRIRKNSRSCTNSLQESVHKSGCATEGDDEDEIWETERCDCSAPSNTVEETETCISQSGVGSANARFELTGLKAGDKVCF